MVLSLYSLLEAILLVVNAAVILDERRFLAKGMRFRIVCLNFPIDLVFVLL